MPEPIEKRVKVTFHTGLPLGTRGTFTHDGQRWIAVPADKYQRLTATIDRLLGVLGGIERHMTNWVAGHPHDTERVAMLLAGIARARQLSDEIARDKVKAATA